MRRLRKWLAVVGGILVLLVSGLGVYCYHPLPPLPPLAPFLERAQQYDATIARDRFGVPTIIGARDVDAAFGLAYAHAEDDWETFQTVLLATRGQLASRDGRGAVPTDVLVALLKVDDIVEGGYFTRLSNPLRAHVEAYADGLNAFAARHPERVAGGLLPITGKDVVAGFVFKTPLFYGLERTIGGLFDKTRRPHLTLDSGRDGKTALQLEQDADRAAIELGSNAFAIAPRRSGDGATRLVINSHQPWTGPVAWWEGRVLSDEGWQVAGGFFPGAPFILHGHTPTLGWAATVNQPDLADVYVLSIDPKDDKRYLLDGNYRKMETRKLKILVRLFGPFAFPLRLDVDFTQHGPVVRGEHATYAVRYAGQGEIREAEQIRLMNRARTKQEWLAAMRMNTLPSINYTYADAEGNIGYVHNAMMPQRKAGFDWSQDLPGDRSDLIWPHEPRVPFDALPQVWNPPSGAVFNANNTPLVATDGAGNVDPASVPTSFGIETHMTNRALRAQELLRDTPIVDRAALLRIKFDDRYAKNSRAAELRAQILALPTPASDALLVQGKALLAKWDLGAEQTNPHAAIAILSMFPVLRAEFQKKPPPDLQESFIGACRTLKKHFGRLDVPWGEVNRLRRGAVDLPLDGGPDTLRAVYGESEPDGRYKGAVGDSLIMLVEWPTGGGIKSESIHQFGAATLDTSSPHYADQAPLFATKTWRPAVSIFDKQTALSTAEKVYKVGRLAP